MVLRVLLSTAAAVAVAVIAVIITAIADLYVTGHGYRSLNRPVIDSSSSGVVIGLSDIGLIVATGLAWVVTWRVTRR